LTEIGRISVVMYVSDQSVDGKLQLNLWHLWHFKLCIIFIRGAQTVANSLHYVHTAFRLILLLFWPLIQFLRNF